MVTSWQSSVKFWAILLILISILSLPVLGDTNTTGTEQMGGPNHITLTWSDDPMTTQTITWRTEPEVSSGVVQYSRNQDVRTPETAPAKVTSLATDTGSENIFSSTLTGLEPGSTYYYRVGDGGQVWSQISSFTTEQENPDHVKLLIFGDSQSGDANKTDYTLWKSTLENAYHSNSNANFFMELGDDVEIGEANAHWNSWFDAAKNVISNLNYMPVEGNHDCYDMSYNNVKPSMFIGQFNVVQNGPYQNAQIYSFDYGDAHFVVLDSQFYEEAQSNPSLLTDEQSWLEKDLSSTQKKWKVAFWHKTPYSTKSVRTNENISAAFVPILDKYHVDVVFNGHDHSYSRTYPMNNNSITSTDAGTVYIIAGRSGAKYYNDNAEKVYDVEYYDPQDMPNYIVADIAGDEFNIKAYKADNTLIDNYTISKTGGDDPYSPIPGKFNKTRLVINGVLLNQPLVGTFPTQIAGKWYFPIQAAVGFLGGSYSPTGDSVDITMKVSNYVGDTPWSDGKNHNVTLMNSSTQATIDSASITLPDEITKDSTGNYLISADSMQVLCGFTWKYNSEQNELILINPDTNN